MAFTDNLPRSLCVVHNGVVRRDPARHAARRPSLFNYATADVATAIVNSGGLPEFTADVTTFGNPIFTVTLSPGYWRGFATPVEIGFCVQTVRAQVDFHPSNVIKLPPELGKELLKRQRAGAENLRRPEMHPDEITQRDHGGHERSTNAVLSGTARASPGSRQDAMLLSRGLRGGSRRASSSPAGQSGRRGVDGVEIVDVKPVALKRTWNATSEPASRCSLRQKLAIAWKTFFVEFPLFGLGTVSAFTDPQSARAEQPGGRGR